MGAYAFFRLLQRPAFVLIVPFAGLVLLMLLLMSLNRDYGAAQRLDLSMLAVPLVIGTVVGQTVYDVRSRLFSWSLPGFQRKVGAVVVGLALVLAGLWTWGYLTWGGGLAPQVGFACFLLIFMLSTVAQRTLLLLWIGLMMVVMAGDAFFSRLLDNPALATGVALLGAGICAATLFSSTVWRQVLRSPHMQLIVNAFNADEVAITDAAKLGRRSAGQAWARGRIGVNLRSWARALEHENTGGLSQSRAVLQAYGPSLLVALMTVSLAFEDRSMAEGLACAFNLFFHPPVMQGLSIYVPVAALQGVVAWAIVVQGPSFSTGGWIYPLSREHRSKVVYRLSLRQGLRIVWNIAFVFSLVAVGSILMGGGSYDFSYLPDFYRGMIAIAVLVPLAQWMHFQLKRVAAQWLIVLRAVGTLVFAFLVAMASQYWPEFMGSLAVPLQAALLLALACATQALYYWLLVKHYRRADLI